MTDELLLKALNLAILSKFKTCSSYRMALLVFGPVQPFKDLLKIEEKYRIVLTGLARRFRHTLPKDEWDDQVAIPGSFVEACENAIEQEREHCQLYMCLSEQVDDPALLRVLMRMRNVSTTYHQPGFKDYLEYARFIETRSTHISPKTFTIAKNFKESSEATHRSTFPSS